MPLFFTLSDLGVARDAPVQRWTKGRQKLAVCLGSLEAEDVSIPALSFQGTTPAGTTTQAESLFRKWNRLHVGPTYSHQITDDLALGVSLHGVFTSESYAIDGAAISNGAASPTH